MDGYSSEIEVRMISFFESLGERDRRRYAAVEATKLGHGGITYISQLFDCDPKTIQQGKSDLENPPTTEDIKRQRKKNGGRKKAEVISSEINENLYIVLKDHTAGDPMRAEVKWTNLSRLQIAKRIADLGTPVSKNIVNKPVYIALAFALLQPYVAPGFSTSSLLEAGVVVRREMWPEFSRTMLVAAKVMLAIGSTSAILVPLDPNRVSPMSSLVNNRVSVRHLQLRTFQNILDCIVQSAAGIFRHH